MVTPSPKIAKAETHNAIAPNLSVELNTRSESSALSSTCSDLVASCTEYETHILPPHGRIPPQGSNATHNSGLCDQGIGHGVLHHVQDGFRLLGAKTYKVTPILLYTPCSLASTAKRQQSLHPLVPTLFLESFHHPVCIEMQRRSAEAPSGDAGN